MSKTIFRQQNASSEGVRGVVVVTRSPSSSTASWMRRSSATSAAYVHSTEGTFDGRGIILSQSAYPLEVRSKAARRASSSLTQRQTAHLASHGTVGIDKGATRAVWCSVAFYC